METTKAQKALISKAELARSLGYPRFSQLSITLRKNKRFCETMRLYPDNAVFGGRRLSRYLTVSEAEKIQEILGHLPIQSG